MSVFGKLKGPDAEAASHATTAGSHRHLQSAELFNAIDVKPSFQSAKVDAAGETSTSRGN
jgi:hypothetical protein